MNPFIITDAKIFGGWIIEVEATGYPVCFRTLLQWFKVFSEGGLSIQSQCEWALDFKQVLPIDSRNSSHWIMIE